MDGFYAWELLLVMRTPKFNITSSHVCVCVYETSLNCSPSIISLAVIKCPSKSNPGKKEFILAHNLRFLSIIVGKSRNQQLEIATSHPQLGAERTHLLSAPVYSRTQPKEGWVLPTVDGAFPFQ